MDDNEFYKRILDGMANTNRWLNIAFIILAIVLCVSVINLVFVLK